MEERYIHGSTLHQSLARLIEECGECLQAAGKIQRFGWLSTDPSLPDGEKKETNLEWLLREMTDLEDGIKRLREKIGNTYQEYKVNG